MLARVFVVVAGACELACPSATGNCKLIAKDASPQVGVVVILLNWPSEIWKVVSGPFTSAGLPFRGLALTWMVDESMTLKLISAWALIGWRSPG